VFFLIAIDSETDRAQTTWFSLFILTACLFQVGNLLVNLWNFAHPSLKFLREDARSTTRSFAAEHGKAEHERTN